MESIFSDIFILFIGANLKYKMVKTHSLYVFDKLLYT